MTTIRAALLMWRPDFSFSESPSVASNGSVSNCLEINVVILHLHLQAIWISQVK